jgi:hypothetical protein
MSTGTVYTAFAQVMSRCRADLPARKQEGRDALYNYVLSVLETQQLLLVARPQSCQFELAKPKPSETLGVTTVRAEFDLLALDGSMLTVGAVGVHVSSELALSNKLVASAQRQALISAFLLPAPGAPGEPRPAEAIPNATSVLPTRGQAVAEKMNGEKGGVARTTTADQLAPPPTPAQRAEATRAMNEWREEIAGLPADNPSAWDVHLTKLYALALVKPQNRQELFEHLIAAAYQHYIDYDSANQSFYLADRTAPVAA